MPPFVAQISTSAFDLFWQTWNDFNFFLASDFGGAVLFVIKLVAIAIAVFFFLGIVYILFQTNSLVKKAGEIKEFFTRSSIEKGRIIRGWKIVTERLKKGTEADYKLAVIEADKIFDSLLEAIGYKGGTMAEKLKKLNKSQLPMLDNIWRAHKIRNELVHNPDFKISSVEAQEAIEIYKKALEEFEIF